MPSWLSRLFSSEPDEEEREGTAIILTSKSRPVDVVGESHYQDCLRQLDQGRLSTGETVAFTGILVPEPENPYDPNAVAIYGNESGKLGHLSRKNAVRYRPVVAALRRRDRLGACDAYLIGGREDAPTIEVRLHLGSPAECLDLIRLERGKQ